MLSSLDTTHDTRHTTHDTRHTTHTRQDQSKVQSGPALAAAAAAAAATAAAAAAAAAAADLPTTHRVQNAFALAKVGVHPLYFVCRPDNSITLRPKLSQHPSSNLFRLVGNTLCVCDPV